MGDKHIIGKQFETSDLILTVRNLEVMLNLKGKLVSVIDNIDFDLWKGSTLGIVGESGSGKSILCKALLQILPLGAEVSGKVYLHLPDGEILNILSLKPKELISVRGKKIGFLFQEPTTSMNPVLKCGKQVFDSLPYRLRRNKNVGMRRVIELFELVGLPDKEKIANSYPHELSGGMLQRVAIAAALAGEPSILIADEPTTALDASLQRKMLQTLSQLQKKFDLTLILVSHDLNIISDWTDNLLVMYSGRIVEYGQTAKILSSPAHPYTQALLETERSFEEKGLPRPIPGALPIISSKPSGCQFHPRCHYTDAQCQVDEPDILVAGHGGGTRCYHPLTELKKN
jgi:oligopeptide/dipeptide ABC transporter ATP-binding protein